MTRLSQVGNSSVYEASDQRGEPTESEQNRRGMLSSNTGQSIEPLLQCKIRPAN